jgi:hypothetical protein
VSQVHSRSLTNRVGTIGGDSIAIGTIGTKNYLLSVVFDYLKLPIVDSFW